MHPRWFIILLLFLFFACKEEVLPKPRALLRLDYPAGSGDLLETDHFQFERNSLARIKKKDKMSLTLDYPNLKGSIFITYKKVENNLDRLLADAQKLSYEHVVKADDIQDYLVVDNEDKVYGMIYEVSGDAASQAQFYVTDSTRHFLTGSLYFYARPNYDSIYPAAVYIQKDIRRIVETLKWN
ncbi:MAG TPA: gliding motility lipoprotein GldD [Eudoraea sp.]|nr:gliding motility lipoprotein GldD [Eudoraea sp.]